MRPLALPLSLAFLSACSSSPPGEREGRASLAFTSDTSTLVNFEFDGRLFVDAETAGGDVKPFIQTQILYTAGQLNGDRSLGRDGELELSNIRISPTDDSSTFEVDYHGKLPVAWGNGAAPSSYMLVLPARVGDDDQNAFAAKYGTDCVTPDEGPPVDVSRMFISYRPYIAGCSLDPNDIVSFPASVSASTGNTNGKYPEYQRIWADNELNVVAMFSVSNEGATDNDDEGIATYNDFVTQLSDYFIQIQPNASKRTAPDGLTQTPGVAMRAVAFTATLDDGRKVQVDVRLTSYHVADDGTDFDDWYNARTPSADAIVYAGHAGLGYNFETLEEKGTFRSGQYMIWFMNSCDTLAYLDRTLVDRRAVLNPDDPNGTKYMDTIANVMPGYFAVNTAITLNFIETLVTSAGPSATPKTYNEFLLEVDPRIGMIITGEEDNTYEPPASEPADAANHPANTSVDSPDTTSEQPQTSTDPSKGGSSCTASAGGLGGGGHSQPWTAIGFGAAACLGVFLRRRRSDNKS
jgi:hypothetical protein